MWYMSYGEKFFSKLRDVFIGAKVEGQGGFINLIRIDRNTKSIGLMETGISYFLV